MFTIADEQVSEKTLYYKPNNIKSILSVMYLRAGQNHLKIYIWLTMSDADDEAFERERRIRFETAERLKRIK